MITVQNTIPNVTDFLVNGKIVAVIGLSGGLEFLKSAKLTYQEIDAVEDKAREVFRHKYNSRLTDEI